MLEREKIVLARNYFGKRPPGRPRRTGKISICFFMERGFDDSK